ncbi:MULTISPECIES: SusD/RagB family nutrient-binding outer membrane lipoprotein [Niastella]|uniref:SusD/RagB family nutrient-binding outer membrane lipoprotein n=1 Tax=Niastella soli TaxID=2821487 RepID=A0ABS3YU08_9BACT|nr:SusD/RagB family nutrient-binding outer membrane lipoprotein [Niastella soli]MBO9200681.1 SusD/RagB family nutrient-binding outer membrane lipoprotein [Niastella soli]
MKNIIKYAGGLLGLVGLFSLQSCDKDFESTNTNPETTAKVYPQYVFTKAQYDGTANMMNFLLGTMQYTTSYNDVAGFGSKYNAAQISQTYKAFDDAYPKEINELGLVIKAVKNEPSQVNLYAEARIWRVYCFSRLTDLYGDIPYFQAVLGNDSFVFKPAYDPQSAIYADLLSELDAAAQSLDAAKVTFGASDLIYGGATDKWKKFAYSLMLRLGMRMTKVDANAAKNWVTKAIAGGVITTDDDIAKMSYLSAGQDINKNPLAFNLWNSDYIAQNGNTNTEGGKYHEVFISYLKSTNDPRLPMMAVVWNNKVADTSVGLAKGMPATLTNAKPANFITYSEPNPKTLLLMNSPRLVFTAAESYYLLTEAALRGWYNGATASSLYQNGIRAAMRQWSLIGGKDGTVAPTAIDNYVTANALNTGGSFDDQMKQLYTQFWVSIFPDAQEVFASFRRTGYPALVPNNYAGNATGGKFFRRMLYPLTEQTLNADSYQTAISRQGANDLLTHIWWDK